MARCCRLALAGEVWDPFTDPPRCPSTTHLFPRFSTTAGMVYGLPLPQRSVKVYGASMKDARYRDIHHHLPVDRWQNKGYHEEAVCGRKVWRYNVSATMRDVDCPDCRVEAALLQQERHEPAPHP